jgi:indolepyruvate ferredoxin oxidoreductase alpha subunit
VLRPAIAGLLGEPLDEVAQQGCKVFPRPPTMCVACPHLGIYYTLAQVRNLTIAGDIGCYTLGAGHPWNALDTCVSMGASMGVALGLDKGRSASDANKRVLAVIGDSTFLHMGMQGLVDITYNRGNVTVLLLDNGAVGMTGGQDNPANGHDIHGNPAPRIDLVKLVEALGVAPARIRKVNPYELPTLFKALREELKAEEPSVIITDQPCVLTKAYGRKNGLQVLEDKCTGCGNCVDVGCPAIHVTRRETAIKPSGKEVQLSFVRIETAACTGCDMCVRTCGLDAIVPAAAKHTVVNFSPLSLVNGGKA